MANKQISTANGVILEVDNNSRIVKAFTNQNNTPNYLQSNDPLVTSAIANVNNSPALRNANQLGNSVSIGNNYNASPPNNTQSSPPANQQTPTSNNNPFYAPIFSDSTGNTEALVYPQDLSREQDRMVITMYRYRNTVNNLFGQRDISKTSEGDGKPLAYIIFPMPNQVGDVSKVEWTPSTMPLGNLIGGLAGGAISKLLPAGDKTTEQLNQRGQDIKAKIENITSDTALQSRFTGTIFNPNQDLLFTGNGLREFTYTFDLFPRNESESTEIRKIVRTLRQGMLPRRVNVAFVGAPNVFRIKFLKGGSDEQLKDVRRHKELALTFFAADPTPGDLWMTHNNPDHSVIGFKIIMQFTELVPIYYNDFVDEKGVEAKDINGESITGSIGY